MKKRILPLVLAVALLCSGCSRLLERSYSHVEPYTNRFREEGAENTLKAENYRDMVNAMLMLIELRAETGVIRFYCDEGSDVYGMTLDARQEVLEETVMGAYMLDDLEIVTLSAPEYHALSCRLTYREDAEDPRAMITISDSRSLVDLLRVSAREGHGKLTARFGGGISRQDVYSAMESLWRELCVGVEAERLPIQSVEGNGTAVADKPVVWPACPWEVRFYPDVELAGVVEIRFTQP